VIQERKTN